MVQVVNYFSYTRDSTEIFMLMPYVTQMLTLLSEIKFS